MTRLAQLIVWIGNRIGKPPGWERVARFFLPPDAFDTGSEILVIREGLIYQVQPWINVGWHVALFGEYEPEVRRIMRTVLGEGGVAVDIGANVGWHTVLLAARAGASGTVLAVEANPRVCACLEKNVHLNKLRNVTILRHALGDREGEVQFYGPSADDESSGRGRVVSDASEVAHSVTTLRVRTLDSVMRESNLERCDLVKIDVEGYEWPVLKGAIETITRFRPHVLFEFDRGYAHRGEGSAEQFDEYFRSRRYTLHRLERNWARPILAGQWPDHAEVWAIPEA